MNNVLMIFIDGIGIGKKDYEFNPFFKYGFETFEKIFGEIPHLENQYLNKNGVYLFPVDARLGVEGLPQSGTGQVSIFCGMNAPKFVGKHFGPFPYSTTIPIIEKENIFKTYKDSNKKVSFVNAFPKVFFDYLRSGKTRLSVTSLSCRLTGVKLNTIKEIRRKTALTAEITNERWNRKLNYQLKIISPEIAARRLLNAATKNDFTLFEFFLTDHLGHGRIADEFDNIYNNLDKFLFTILTELNSDELTLVICSDHGNIEDLSIKTHTLNPALTITAGKNAKQFAESIKDLSDIKPSIIKYST
ncbi:MAG TPA: alkaline phosphatase family protein [Ignavibacteriaceae bacterium]|nr:alkaline phosphatase family protein [Ignavibacteriaceae bacterium]HRP93476.1 alkaline phosphatase family protein [Ignavibacteriaceae bacterium]